VADPEVSTEYVLLVEVDVDVSGIEGALRAAGLLRERPPQPPSQELRVVVEHLPSYGAYAALCRHLREQAGATSVIPDTFESGRVELRVAGRMAPSELIDRLVAPPPEGLMVEPIFADGRSVWIRIVELPETPED
jgi:hypothetical protein